MSEDADTVYRPVNASGHYHDDEDCPYGPADPYPLSRAEAQRAGYEPCSYCVLGDAAERPLPGDDERCTATTTDGRQCHKQAVFGDHCDTHADLQEVVGHGD